jgi:hypothetical protein
MSLTLDGYTLAASTVAVDPLSGFAHRDRMAKPRRLRSKSNHNPASASSTEAAGRHDQRPGWIHRRKHPDNGSDAGPENARNQPSLGSDLPERPTFPSSSTSKSFEKTTKAWGRRDHSGSLAKHFHAFVFEVDSSHLSEREAIHRWFSLASAMFQSSFMVVPDGLHRSAPIGRADYRCIRKRTLQRLIRIVYVGCSALAG